MTTSIGTEAVFRKFFSTYGKCDTSELEELHILVVGDQNSPKIDFQALPEYQLLEENAITFSYLDPAAQEAHMQEKPFMEELIPWKCVQRRNLGYLIGYREGYDCIITVDDDNYPIDKRFAKQHAENLYKEGNCPIVSADEDFCWYNPCAVFDSNIIHRGFPWQKRYEIPNVKMGSEDLQERKIVASAGFWIGDPDIDAISRVEGNPKNIKVKTIDVANFCLAKNVIGPFNSQNTAFRREIIPAAFLKANIGRYDDIWAAYLVRALCMVTGDLVMYGHPLVEQDRNDHDILKDLELELFGMRHTLAFTQELFSYVLDHKDSLTDRTYLDMTRGLAGALAEHSKHFDWYYRDLLCWVELLEP